MSAETTIQEFANLVFGDPQVEWWKELKGEVRQGREAGRYLEVTIEEKLRESIPEYRSKSETRTQYFFSKGGKIDGRYKGLGVEEKCAVLSRDKLIDGVLCRGLVWVLGNPQNVEPAELGATGIFVTLGDPLRERELAAAFFGAIGLARRANVVPFFVDGLTGRRWPHGTEDSSHVPDWLVESGLALPSGGAPDADLSALSELGKRDYLPPTEPFFGQQKRWRREHINGVSVADAEWGNEWQMLDVGLMLRAMGHAAVRVRYTGERRLTRGPHGVEGRVGERMRAQFGVALDWGHVE
ncbi:MAG: hypothetical protein ABI548_15095 [Polyangiaceae bacterium]